MVIINFKLKNKMARGKKSVYFTIDALLSAGILIAVLIFTSSSYVSENAPPSNNFAADDLLNVLSNLKVSEANSSYVSSLIGAGDITKLNNTLLEQIGELWAEGNIVKAQNIVAEFADNFTSKNLGAGFYVNGEQMFSREKNEFSTVVSRKRLVSGIQKNRAKDGYIARAVAIKTRKNNTLVVAGDVIKSAVEKSPSGNNQNLVNITYDVFIPDNSTVLGASWFIEAAWTGIKFDAYINGQFVGSGSPSDNGQKKFDDVGSYLSTGHNNATIIFKFGNANNPEGGDDGATHFIVNYSTKTPNTLQNLNRKYLALVSSNASIRYSKPVFVVGDINSIDIHLNVTAQNVSLNYTLDGETYFVSRKNAMNNTVSWANSEITSAMALNGHSLSSLNGKYFWLVFDIDQYHTTETKERGRQVLKNSYIDVDADAGMNVYGLIDLTRIVPLSSSSNSCGGSFADFYKNLTWRFDVSNSSVPLMIDSQFAWLYSSGSDPQQLVKANQNTLYHHPPSPLIREFARWGYSKDNGNIINGISNYTIGFSTGYCVQPSNSIVTYTSLINNFVNYGSTFNTLQEAIDDANSRLAEVLGDYADATEINNDIITLKKVPSMWGPSVMEARVWQ